MPRKPIEDVPDSAKSAGGVNRLYRVLSRVNEAIVRIREPQELYEEACRIAVEDGRFLLAWIGFAEPGSDFIHPVANFGHDDGYLDSVRLSLSADVPEGQGPTGIALREGRAFINNDTASNPIMRPWRDEQLKRGFRSSASFPLKNGRETVGVMTLYAGEADFFDDEEVGLLAALADDFSFALESASKDEANRRLETATLLLEAAEQLNKSLDIGVLLERLAGIALRATAHSRAYVGLLSEDRTQLTFAPNLGLEALPSGTVVPWDGLSLPLREALTTAETRVAEYSEVPVAQRGIADTVDSRTALLVPIVFDAQVLGHIAIDDPHESKGFTDADIQIVQGIASQAAIAMQNARLFEAERVARERTDRELQATQALLDTTTLLTKWTELRPMLVGLADALAQAGAHSRVSVSLWHEEQQEIETVASRGERAVPCSTIPLGEMTAPVRRMMKTRKHVLVDYAKVDQAGMRERAARWDMRYVLFVPVVAAGRIIATISVDEPGQRKPFSDREIDLVKAVAEQAGAAIENARLIESERIQATRVQALSEIGRLVTSSLDVDSVVDRSLEQVVSQLGVTATSLWIAEDGERLRLRGARGFGEAFFADFAEGLPLDAPHDVVRAFNSGEPIVHEDAAASDVATPVKEAYARYGLPLGSLVALPLRSPSGVVGALTLAWDHARTFTDADVAFDALLADTFAIGLQNARLFEAERAAQEVATRELAATSALLEAANELNRWTDLPSLLETLVTLVLRLVPDSRVNIGIAAEDRSSMTMAAGGGERPFPTGAVVPWDQLTSGSRGALENGRTSMVDFEQLEEGGIANEYGSRLALFVALRFADRVVGQIGIDVPGERHDFTTREISLIEGIASQAAVAIENARLFGDRRTQAERAEVLKELAEIGVAGVSVSDVAERQAQAIIGLLGASHAAVVLSDGERLQPVALVGYPDEYVEKLTPLPEDALASQAFHSGRPRFVDDLHIADTSEFTKTVSSDLGFGSFAALPLGPPEAPIGAVGFVWKEARRFDCDEVTFLEAVASELAVGLSNQWAQDSVRESARLSDALNVANAAVHSTLDIDQVMQGALETGVHALGCDAAAVEMLDGDEWVVRYQSGFALSDIGTRLSKEQAPNATSALLQAAPLAIADLQADPERNVGFVKQYGLKSVLAVPLNAKSQTIGCALFYAAGTIKHFTDAEVDFGRKLGSSVSLALENARLYGTERTIANVLQSALLTLPASLPGFEFANAYSSATEMTNVGGDFYDIFELDEHHIGVTIGDVSGKGLDAAVLTSLIRNSIRAYASEDGMGPSKVLSQANQIVHKSTPTEIFTTVFFAIVDRRDGCLLYANAGHPAAAVLKADGTSARLSATGPLLGAFPGMRFEEREMCLGPDDLLFLYTDGLTEARRDREFYGEERLFEFLSTTRSMVPRHVVEAVLADVESYAGDRLRDDLAILAVRRVVA